MPVVVGGQAAQRQEPLIGPEEDGDAGATKKGGPLGDGCRFHRLWRCIAAPITRRRRWLTSLYTSGPSPIALLPVVMDLDSQSGPYQKRKKIAYLTP